MVGVVVAWCVEGTGVAKDLTVVVVGVVAVVVVVVVVHVCSSNRD